MRATFRRLKDRPDYVFLGAKTDGRLVGSVLGIVCEELYGQCVPFMVVEDVIVDIIEFVPRRPWFSFPRLVSELRPRPSTLAASAGVR